MNRTRLLATLSLLGLVAAVLFFVARYEPRSAGDEASRRTVEVGGDGVELSPVAVDAGQQLAVRQPVDDVDVADSGAEVRVGQLGSGSLIVRVSTRSEEPVPGEEVYYSVDHAGLTPSESQLLSVRRSAGSTDQLGQRLIRGLPVGSDVSVHVRDLWGRVQIAAGPSPAVLDLTFPDSGRVLGRVVTASGAPLADVLVSVSVRAGEEQVAPPDSTDSFGRFEFERVRAGRAVLEVGVRGFDPLEFTIASDGTTDLGDIVRPVLGGVSGMILADAAALASLHVRLVRSGSELARSRVDEAGHFALEASEGEGALQVFQDGAAAPLLHRRIDVPSSGVVLELTDVRMLTLQVGAEFDGEAAVARWLGVQRDGDWPPERLSETRTDVSDGCLRLLAPHGRERADLVVELISRGRGACLRNLDLSGDGRVLNLEFGTGAVSIDGLEPGLRVVLEGVASGAPLESFADDRGECRVEVQPGPWRIRAGARGDVPRLMEHRWIEARAVVRLGPGDGTALRGALVGFGGDLPATVLLAAAASNGSRRLTVDSKGRFDGGVIAPGDYYVIVKGWGWRGISAVAGEALEVEIRIDGVAEFTVVTPAAFQTIGQVDVYCTEAGRGSLIAVSLSDGSFAVPQPSGPVLVEVMGAAAGRDATAYAWLDSGLVQGARVTVGGASLMLRDFGHASPGAARLVGAGGQHFETLGRRDVSLLEPERDGNGWAFRYLFPGAIVSVAGSGEFVVGD